MSRAWFSPFLFIFSGLPFFGWSQSGSAVQSDTVSSLLFDSVKHALALQTKPADRVETLLALCRYSLDTGVMRSYERQALDVAELSRNRALMVDADLQAASADLNMGGLRSKVEEAISHFEDAVKIAKENDLEFLLVRSYCGLAKASDFVGDYQKALAYSNEAFAIAGNLDNDSAKVYALLAQGDTYLGMKEKLLSLRCSLQALDLAENMNAASLLRYCYSNLDWFYRNINDYDKSIDYCLKEIAIDRQMWNPENLLTDEFHLGDMFARNKELSLALKIYEHTLAFADSTHYDLFKASSYYRLCNMYINTGQFAKGGDYLRTHPQALSLLNRLGLTYGVNFFYALAFDQEGKRDSAYYYFKKAEIEESKMSPPVRSSFYVLFGNFYAHNKDYRNAASYLLRGYALCEETRDMDGLVDVSQGLDSVYLAMGDYKSAYTYNLKYHEYKDSIQALSRETDLMKLEVENDARRRERLAREEEIQTEHRHNLQYTGFTIGLVLLFISLVMLGWFAVPTNVIRVLGFLSFIFLFEFIIMLADKRIVAWTHEEPWKVLLIKIVLAAGLVPLHHWLEHKVIHYLSQHKTGFKWREPAAAGSAAGSAGETMH